MTEDIKPIRNYPFRGKIYTAKQIDALISGGVDAYTKAETDTLLATKQNVLTAGSNITISDNTISATDTTYTAGSNVTISDGVISATDTTYTAGTGISISDGVISAISGGDWILKDSVNWKTGIIEELDNNYYKFLKDVMIISGGNNTFSHIIPKNTCLLKSTYIIVYSGVAFDTTQNYTTLTLNKSSLVDIFTDTVDTIPYTGGTIKVYSTSTAPTSSIDNTHANKKQIQYLVDSAANRGIMLFTKD